MKKTPAMPRSAWTDLLLVLGAAVRVAQQGRLVVSPPDPFRGIHPMIPVYKTGIANPYNQGYSNHRLTVDKKNHKPNPIPGGWGTLYAIPSPPPRGSSVTTVTPRLLLLSSPMTTMTLAWLSCPPTPAEWSPMPRSRPGRRPWRPRGWRTDPHPCGGVPWEGPCTDPGPGDRIPGCGAERQI